MSLCTHTVPYTVISARDTTFTGLHPHRLSALVSTRRGGATASTFVRPVKPSRTPQVLEKPLASTSPGHRGEDLDRASRLKISCFRLCTFDTFAESYTFSTLLSPRFSRDVISRKYSVRVPRAIFERCSSRSPSVSTRSISTRPPHPSPTRSAATFVGVQARTSQVVSLCIGFQRRLHQVLLSCEPSWKFPGTVDFCEQPSQEQLSNPAHIV